MFTRYVILMYMIQLQNTYTSDNCWLDSTQPSGTTPPMLLIPLGLIKVETCRQHLVELKL